MCSAVTVHLRMHITPCDIIIREGAGTTSKIAPEGGLGREGLGTEARRRRGTGAGGLCWPVQS